MTLLPTATLNALRAITESSMVDTCTITRDGTGTPVLDENTGLYTDPPRVTVFTGPCRVRHLANQRAADFGEENIALRQYGATLPREADGVAEGDILTVTASDDSQLVGRPFYVLSVGWSTENLHRRLNLEDRQYPLQAGS